MNLDELRKRVSTEPNPALRRAYQQELRLQLNKAAKQYPERKSGESRVVRISRDRASGKLQAQALIEDEVQETLTGDSLDALKGQAEEMAQRLAAGSKLVPPVIYARGILPSNKAKPAPIAILPKSGDFKCPHCGEVTDSGEWSYSRSPEESGYGPIENGNFGAVRGPSGRKLYVVNCPNCGKPVADRSKPPAD